MIRAALVATRAPKSTQAAARLAIAATLGAVCFGVYAQVPLISSQQAPRHPPAATSEGLERAFWVCDHAAVSRAFDGGDAMACSTVTEELKSTKFGGDFDAMLAWWNEGRDAAHRALDAASARIAASPLNRSETRKSSSP